MHSTLQVPGVVAHGPVDRDDDELWDPPWIELGAIQSWRGGFAPAIAFGRRTVFRRANVSWGYVESQPPDVESVVPLENDSVKTC